jgi:hypothetical protein
MRIMGYLRKTDVPFLNFKALSARRFGLWSPAWPSSLARRRNMPPLSLTDEEMSLLRELAAPIPLRQRQEFLLAIAAELETEQTAGTDIGPGLIHRVASRLHFGPAPQPMAGKYARP